jgi:uncharacterized protein YjbJ (UPF0337 family)
VLKKQAGFLPQQCEKKTDALRVERMSVPGYSEPTTLVTKIGETAAEAQEPESTGISTQAAVLGLETLSQLFDDAIQSGETDQLRGYANAAMGEAKLAVGRAVESPNLTIAGIAQVALGAIQRYVGEEKLAPDEERCAQTRREEGRPSASGS